MKVCGGKISEGQSAAESRDALERIGPAELEKVWSETSRGPYHSTGPPRKPSRMLLKMEKDVNACLQQRLERSSLRTTNGAAQTGGSTAGLPTERTYNFVRKRTGEQVRARPFGMREGLRSGFSRFDVVHRGVLDRQRLHRWIPFHQRNQLRGDFLEEPPLVGVDVGPCLP